ncbi:SMC5-SMC6 complex localization factor protein 2 isoform X2 [Pyrgilauda ruficollis]|uniref:SMC5-SMC6 complex localization factor protein 2 isoform X2 n=1 Tax=Pyrgilauda ruficollis TaxID=221976 RepID=UPI001B860207|nr:SMC5-SMC6 complex localization factor protein 2 isoform X2 [Pyrgilauda ruficollis]
MTRPLGEGLPSPGPPFAMSRRHVTPAAAGREAAQDCRNQLITEFFKPVLSQDRTVLSSPDKGNVKDEGMGLSVLCAEGFERNSPSPRKVRRKRCQTKHQMSPVGNGCPVRKIMPFGSREIAPDDPTQLRLTQVLEHEASSPHALRTSSEMASGAPKSPAAPSHFLKVSFGLSKPRDSPGKRKQSAMSVDADSPEQSEVNDPDFSRPSKCKNLKCGFVKNIFLKSPHDDVLQLKEPAALSRHDLTLSEEFLNSSNEKEKNNYSTVVFSPSYSAHSPAKNNHISVVDTKENQLQLANSCFSLEKSLPFSQEKSTVLLSPHYLTQTKGMKSPLQVAGLSQVLDVRKEQDKRPERHERNKGCSIQPSNSFSNAVPEISENTSDSCRMEISGRLGLSPETGKGVPPSWPLEEPFVDSSHESSQPSGELEVKRNSTHKSKLSRKWQSSSESEDDILESILDDDDEEEALMPLQRMLSSNHRQSLKPQAKTLEDSFDNASQDTVTPLLKLHLSKTPVISKVSYVNSLDHLLKEKEESRRLEEIAKQLQEDIEREDNASDGEKEDNASGDDLLEEHRAFIKRFSVATYVIPDKHPGEDLFDLSAAGKIFTQHNLDLRNFHLVPHNRIEYLLVNSSVTQQLFLVVNGILSSAYRDTLCPIPILKWLFQMMSIHSDHCVSTKILDRLMELSLKNSSISDEQLKPWIPSIADISTVFVNMGVGFRSLFPLQHLQPPFTEHDILSQVQESVSQQRPRGDEAIASPALPSLLENNLINVIKFLVFCTSVIRDGYTDQEIWLLLILLFKISLEKQLKPFMIDFQCLFFKLLMNIKDWDTKMSELCLSVSELSSSPHNLLWLVQLVPSCVARGREVKRRLSLVIIAKFLHRKHVEIPDDSDKQMFLLHHFLVCMKPSYLLKKMREMRKEQNEHKDDEVHAELEHEVYYLIYVLLHLVSEASFLDVVNSSQRQHLLKLCRALDKHVKGDIREDARMFYRSKVKGLAARIYGKWQDVIQTTRLTQGKLHDFWEPDS